MNWRGTLVLLTVAAALFAFIMLVEQPLREERAREAMTTVLPGFDPSAVTNIEVVPRGQTLISANRLAPAGWALAQPIRYPADAAPIGSLLDALAQLEWQSRITGAELRGRPNAQEEFGLAQPQFSLVIRSAGLTRRLVVGATTAAGDQVYIQLVGDSDIFLVPADLLKILPHDRDQWRDRTLFNAPLDAVNAVRVRSQGRSFDVTRDPDTHHWAMTMPVHARADTDKIDALLAHLKDLQVIAFARDDVDPDRLGFQNAGQPLDLTLLRDTNVLFNLQVGPSPDGYPACAFARRADPSNIVLVATAPVSPWEDAYTNFLDRHLFSLPLSEVSQVETKGDDAFTARRQPSGQWEVDAGSQTFAADPLLMDFWLGSLTNIEADIEKTVVADLTAYGLSPPALQYQLERAGAGATQLLASIQFGSSQGGRAFERNPDEASVNTIPDAEFGRLPRASWQLRDRAVWHFDGTNVFRVAIHHLGGERVYLRDPTGQWTFAPGYHGPPFINGPELEEALHRLGDLRAIYWDGVGDDRSDRFGIAAADHRVTLSVKTNDGTADYTIAFGRRSAYLHPYAAVTRDGQRLIFEFPADLYDNFVVPDLSLPAALRWHP